MELTCSRCHQPLDAESCYCPTCGLPQLVYTGDANPGVGQAAPEKGADAVAKASEVEWRPALRVCMLLALPAGLLCCGISPLGGILGLFWMLPAAAWAVSLYMRGKRPAWITMGAGARIGLVTGLMAAALAFSVTGLGLFAERFLLHQSGAMDTEWRVFVEATTRWSQHVLSQMGLPDQGQSVAQKNLMLSPEGHAGYLTFNIAAGDILLILFAAAGGAMGARLGARSRRPQV